MESSSRPWPLAAEELKPALELALELERGDMGVLMLHDDSLGAVLPALGIGLNEQQFAAIGPHRPGVGPIGRAIITHRRVTVRDAWRADSAMPELAHRVGFRGIDILPLFALDGHTVGVIAVMFRRGGGAHRRQKRLADQCGRLLTTALTHAQGRSMSDEARLAAESIARAKVQFLARMSHELRTPLQSIAGYLDLLRMDTSDPLTPSQMRHIERMAAAEQILVHVINDLSTFSQLEAGHVIYRPCPTAANDVMFAAEAVVSPLAIDRGVRLAVLAAPEHVTVFGDADKLKQILVNLTANAVKFTQRGGRVTLGCRFDSEFAYLDVADTGPGIAADRLNSIFEPYVQLGAPMLGGSGLGLAISRDFAAGMHGELTVRSSVGKGSIFTLRVPLFGGDGVPAGDGASSFATAARVEAGTGAN
jgi:signal transduction histidine kinase